MFQISIDPKQHLVSVKLGGFMQVEEVADYVARIGVEFVTKIGPRPYVMLIDTSGAPLQSQDVVETFRAHIATFPRATRIALITGSSLSRMQLRRLLSPDYAQFFDSVDEALAWLFPNGRVARAA